MSKIIDPLKHAKKAQVGVDLTVEKIEEIVGYPEFVDSKMSGVEYVECDTVSKLWFSTPHDKLPMRYSVFKERDAYVLKPNTTYAITFEQGLKSLNDNEWGFIVQRSSFMRVGISLESSVWDPGFGTEKMASMLRTGNCEVIVPKGTRIAQFLIFDNEPTELYSGRWQGKSIK